MYQHMQLPIYQQLPKELEKHVNECRSSTSLMQTFTEALFDKSFKFEQLQTKPLKASKELFSQ